MHLPLTVKATDALPIDGLLPQIVHAVRDAPTVLLRAAPGAGKTTRVPAALLDAGVAGAREILVLEPRRIAARAAAEFVAAARGQRVGDDVGYRIRFEQRGGAATRLWFATEGMFERQLSSDPFLERVAVVVLDEFHERHLQGDLALAVVRELQATVRPDLRLVVMSATLGTDALAAALDGAVVIESSGRAFPVTTHWAVRPLDPRALASVVGDAVRRAITADEDDGGDLLVFLPGAGEIRRAHETLAAMATERGFDVVTLHGDQSIDLQVRALRRGPRRRVVLATNVAETALTVDGVTTVIDSGLARVARFDARYGLNRLRVVPISRASADQRAGRAGRTAPGRCYRLWTRGEDSGRRAHETAEILRLDLSRLLLTLRGWGLASTAALRWLDPPPAAAVAAAERLLRLLGALDADNGQLTDVGRALLAVPVEPRIGRMLLEATRRDCAAEGALLAALASERDILAGARAFGGTTTAWPPGPSDLLLRADLMRDALRRGGGSNACAALGLEPRAVRAVEGVWQQLARSVQVSARFDDQAAVSTLSRCVLAGFPDRVARRRADGTGRARMVGGTGVTLAPESVVREAALFVAVAVESGHGPEALVRLASAIEPAWLTELFPHACQRREELVFDDARRRVVARTQERFADLVLSEQVRTEVPALEAGVALFAAVQSDPARRPPLGTMADAWLARLYFLAAARPELEMPMPAALVATALESACAGRSSLDQLARLDWLELLRGLCPHAAAQLVEREAPSHFDLPTGRRVPIHYSADRPPAAAARLQELFGLEQTPPLAGGRVRLVLEILSPSQRPVQITDDLASFWRNGYPQVRKELRGRYPKHAWPDDPLTATPTARVRRPR